MTRTRLPLLLAALTALGLGACERGAADAPDGADAAVGGMPQEQLERQGEAMSPEQAEALGIVDTTIHVENLADPADTIPPPPEP